MNRLLMMGVCLGVVLSGHAVLALSQTNAAPAVPPIPSEGVSAAAFAKAVANAAPVSTNEGVQLQKKLAEIELEARKLVEREGQAKTDYRTAVERLSGVVTNFAATSEDALKIKQRMDELEKELRELRQKRDVLMADSTEYKALKEKVEAARSELQSIQSRKEELRQQRMTTSGRIWQLRRLEEIAAASARQAAAGGAPATNAPAGAKP